VLVALKEEAGLLSACEWAGRFRANEARGRHGRSSPGAGGEERALPRVLDSNLRVTAFTDTGGTMTKRIFEEGTLEAMARLREQDDEFCRRLRIAVEMGKEFCPTTVSTEPCTNRPILL